MHILKQSTAATFQLGPLVDATDGYTPETGLTVNPEDVLISKNGAALAARDDPSGGSPTSFGCYTVILSSVDTNTVGRLVAVCVTAGARPVRHEFYVVPAGIYTALTTTTTIGATGLFTASAVAAAPSAAASFSVAQPATLGALVSQPLQAYRYAAFSWSIPFATSQTGGTLKFVATSLSDRTTALWTLDSTHFTIAEGGLSATVADTDAYTTSTGRFFWFIHNTTTDRRAAEGALTIEDGPNITA